MGGTGTNTGYLYTQGHGSSCFYYISPSYTMALLLMTLRVGMSREKGGGVTVFMWLVHSRSDLWADAACVCLREALRGQRHLRWQRPHEQC